MNLTVLLWGIPQAMRAAAKVYPEYAARLRERNLVAQFRLRDKPEGRWIKLENGKITTRAGLHKQPDLDIHFKNRAIAERFLTPPFNLLERVDAAKNFKIGLNGPDELAVWFMQTLARLESVTWKAGTDMGNGVTRYTNGTNGGPIFVYVKDGRILRTTPTMTPSPGPSRPAAGSSPRHARPPPPPTPCARSPWCTPRTASCTR
jgi:hypothetical protein